MKTKNKAFDTLDSSALGWVLVSTIAAFGVLLLAGCSFADKKVYHCYDEQGHPLPDVLFMRRYIGSTLTGYYSAGVNYRFSDADGVVRFGSDEITRKMGFAVDMSAAPEIYSVRMHNNDPQERDQVKSKGNSPRTPTSGKGVGAGQGDFYFRDNTNDPIKWHMSLCGLLANAECIKDKSYRWDGVGIERLQAAVIPLARKERELFMQKYGEMIVPIAYIQSWLRFRSQFPDGLKQERWGALKFKDVTPFE